MLVATPVAGFACAGLSAFCRLDEFGLVVTGQWLEPERAVLACRVVAPDQWCRHCGFEGTSRDCVTHRLAHEAFGWRPTALVVVTIRHYRRNGCWYVWRRESGLTTADCTLLWLRDRTFLRGGSANRKAAS